MKAPDFSLLDQNGNTHTLNQYRGKWVIIYFYPKDNTPGCTKEACGFSDSYSLFAEKNAVILGVSKDTIQSHKKFSDKFNLPFPLLSDPAIETIKAYGAWGRKFFLGREYYGILRNTYLIDPSGNINKVYEKVNPLRHPQSILQELSILPETGQH